MRRPPSQRRPYAPSTLGERNDGDGRTEFHLPASGVDNLPKRRLYLFVSESLDGVEPRRATRGEGSE